MRTHGCSVTPRDIIFWTPSPSTSSLDVLFGAAVMELDQFYLKHFSTIFDVARAQVLPWAGFSSKCQVCHIAFGGKKKDQTGYGRTFFSPEAHYSSTVCSGWPFSSTRRRRTTAASGSLLGRKPWLRRSVAIWERAHVAGPPSRLTTGSSNSGAIKVWRNILYNPFGY